MKSFVLSSTNEAKKQATIKLLEELYGKNFQLHCVDTTSGVPETPTTDDEGTRGALNRIASAQKAMPGYDGYLGLEGIITSNDFGSFLCGWAVIKLKDGRIGYGCSAKVKLPDTLVKDFDNFRKLSEVTATMYPDHVDSLTELGTNGVITNGLYTRIDEFNDALRCAIGTLSS